MDINTLEQHHNALQIMFNLLLHSLAQKAPGVLDDWLSEVRGVLDETPQIHGKQREIMEKTVRLLAKVRSDSGAVH